MKHLRTKRRETTEVFGGILGNVIENEDGSYGSDDRTSEIRRKLSESQLVPPSQAVNVTVSDTRVSKEI